MLVLPRDILVFGCNVFNDIPTITAFNNAPFDSNCISCLPIANDIGFASATFDESIANSFPHVPITFRM